MSEQDEEKIVINGEEHLVSSFTNQQKYFVNQIKALQERENAIKFDLDQVVVAKQSFSDFLVKSFEKPEEEKKEEN